jgi:hypothetical protein
MQYQLRGKKHPDEIKVETQGKIDALYRMNQGMMDYVGAMVADKRGLGSVA